MTAGERRIARFVLGPRRFWNPDIALRYLPIVRLIEEAGLAGDVTDVGSGSVGIAPYLKRPIIGVDTAFPEPVHPLMRPVRSSVLRTPFGDASRPCVTCVDMLEHLSPADRQDAVHELVRIAGRLLVVAVPSGRAAEEHDEATAELFRTARGADLRFLLEHVENGLPSPDELEACVRQALGRHRRVADVTLLPNVNLRLRDFVVRRWIRRRLLDKVAWVVLTWASPLLARANGGVPYRQVAVVRFPS